MKRILLILIAIITVSHLQAQEVVMQDGMVSQCTGTFTDSGGSSGTYSSNENLTFTLCPDIADSQMVLDFTAFSTQQAVDVMTIYDGDDNTEDFPQLTHLVYDGEEKSKLAKDIDSLPDEYLRGVWEIIADKPFWGDAVGFQSRCGCRRGWPAPRDCVRNC